MKIPIFDITPFSALDYPDRLACIVWFSSCNMRCSYCYNPEIVRGEGRLSCEQLLDFLKKRQGLLNGVVLSGGEVSLFDDLPELCKQIKELGYSIKIDTNGSRPHVLKGLLEQKLIDYVALDFKAPSEKFTQITKSNHYAPFLDSLQWLIQAEKESNFQFEVRTTYHSYLLSLKDLTRMSNLLRRKGYLGEYFVQNFRDNCPTLQPLPDHSKFIDQDALPAGIHLRNFN